MNTNIAIIAISKDEGAYIHEWIHHHLYFGFSEIFIAVNRTADSTYEVLDAIASKHPQFHMFIVDWVD